MSVMNPGEELRDFLTELYPISGSSFVEKIDSDFKGDGELSGLIHLSIMNYLVRRLITTAENYQRQYNVDWKVRLRSFLQDFTRLRDRHILQLIELLSKCLAAKESKISEGSKNKIRKDTKTYGHDCCVCGKPFNHSDDNTPESLSVDHDWPRSMGGVSSDPNLKAVHRRCNSDVKRDYIDYSDYHYEEISLPSGSLFASNDERWAKKHHEGAVFAKTNYACAFCNQPAHRVGELKVGRKDDEDGWHFLNLLPYCINHSPE